MSELKNETKLPTKEGLENARKLLKEIRRKTPSPELVQIIDDLTQENESKIIDDRAARPQVIDTGI